MVTYVATLDVPHHVVEYLARGRTLQYVTLSPSRIGDIDRAALVLNGIRK